MKENRTRSDGIFELNTFSKPLNVVVVGGTGGIGSAFCDLLRAHPAIGKLFILSRRNAAGNDDAIYLPADIEDETSIAKAAESIKAEAVELDLVIVATGILHDGDALTPEKSLRALDAQRLERLMRINAIGPALVAKHFLPLCARDRKTAFAALSARVGSISDNRLGGWYGYRASKAALNMFLKTLAIEHARTHPEGICVGLHPGTVDSGLSKPFQAGVSEAKLFTPEYSAAMMLNVLNGLEPAQSGKLFAYDGSEIAF